MDRPRSSEIALLTRDWLLSARRREAAEDQMVSIIKGLDAGYGTDFAARDTELRELRRTYQRIRIAARLRTEAAGEAQLWPDLLEKADAILANRRDGVLR